MLSHWMLRRLNSLPNNGYYNFALECRVHIQKAAGTQTVLTAARRNLHSGNSFTPKYHPVFPNYTILRQDRPPFRVKGGGLLICIKSSLKFSEVNLSGPSTRIWRSSGSPWAVMRSSTSIIHPLTTCKRKILFFSQDLEKLSCVATSTLTTVCGAVSVQIITAVFYSLFSNPRTLSF